MEPRKPKKPEDPELLAAIARYRENRNPADLDLAVSKAAHLVDLTLKRVVPNLPAVIDPGDLRSEGYIRLIKAVTDYNPARGVRFETYAIYLIRTGMLNWLRKEDSAPEPARARQTLLRQAEELVERRELRRAEDSEIAAELGIGLDRYYTQLDLLRRWEERPVNIEEIDEPGPANDRSPLDGLLTMHRAARPLFDPAPSPHEQVERREMQAAVQAAIATLPAIEREVLVLHEYEELTFAVISKRLGRSRDGTRLIYHQALEHLREALEDDERILP